MYHKKLYITKNNIHKLLTYQGHSHEYKVTIIGVHGDKFKGAGVRLQKLEGGANRGGKSSKDKRFPAGGGGGVQKKF